MANVKKDEANMEAIETPTPAPAADANMVSALLGMLAPQLLGLVEQAVVKNLPGLLNGLVKGLGGIFSHGTSATSRPPIVHPEEVHPIPDDLILPPTVVTDKVTVTRVAARLLMAQYSAKLNPDMYERKEGDQGLYDNIQDYDGGKNALNRESKFWIDATVFAKGADGVELELDKDHPDVRRLGLAYKTQHVIHDIKTDTITQIVGKGAGPDGKPAPGYLEETNTFVGMGITAWINSLGLNCQFKAFGEGEVEYWVVVDGVESNHGRLRFS